MARSTAQSECRELSTGTKISVYRKALPPVHLLDDLLVIDPLQELSGEPDAGGLAAATQLVEEAVGDELEPLLDQLVVDPALALDFFGSLELRGKSGLELAEANIVESGGVDVIPSDSAAGFATHLDGAVDSPIGVLRVIDRNENLAVHHYLPE